MDTMAIDDRIPELAHRLETLLEEDGPGGIGIAATSMRIHDLALVLAHLEDQPREKLFLALPPYLAAEVLEELPPELRDELLESTNDDHLVQILTEASADDAVYFLDHIDDDRATTLLGRLDEDLRALVSVQFELPDDAAGHIMSRELAILRPFMTAQQAIDHLRDKKKHEGPLYVVDAANRLVGVLRFRELLFAASGDLVSSVMEKDPLKVRLETDREAAVELMQRYHLSAVPVVDSELHLLGTITWDDAFDILEAEAEEDMLAIAGTAEDPEDNDNIWERSLKRLPYLIVTVVGGFAMARIIDGRIDGLLSQYTILMGFLPMVPALAGSIGLQCSTVTVRSIATNGIGGDQIMARSIKEISTGVFLGLILAIICGIGAAAIIHFDPNSPMMLAAIIGTALFLALSLAGLMGVLIPLGCQKFGIDPAIAAGPFITMLNDVAGVTIYLVTASVMTALL